MAKQAKDTLVAVEDELLPSSHVARWLGVSDVWMARDRVRGGGIPYLKLGLKKQSIVRYRRSDVERYIAERTRRSTSDDGKVTG